MSRRGHRHPGRGAAGFTLIELLVALAIFMVLGLLSYRALSSIIDSRDRLATEQQRWQAVTRFVQRLELDLQQVALGWPDAVSYDASRQTLRLIRLVAGAAGDEVRTVRYRWRDGRVERDERKWLALPLAGDTGDLVAPEVALEAVERVEWNWSQATPGGGAGAAWLPPPATAGGLPPEALRLRLKLTELPGELTRVVVLR